ncbi:MAG: hypothetical protein ACI9T9_001250 [Oleiphilaceae bacterium]|jgi:hypothetical protein
MDAGRRAQRIPTRTRYKDQAHLIANHFVGVLFDQPNLQNRTSLVGWVKRSEPQHAPDTETKLILSPIIFLGFSSFNPSYKTLHLS